MVDTADSKSAAREGVRVQVSSPVKALWLQDVCSEAIFFGPRGTKGWTGYCQSPHRLVVSNELNLALKQCPALKIEPFFARLAH